MNPSLTKHFKQNSANSLKNLYNEDEEMVKRLSFFNVESKSDQYQKNLKFFIKSMKNRESYSNSKQHLEQKGFFNTVKSPEKQSASLKNIKYMCNERTDNEIIEKQLETERKEIESKLINLKFEYERKQIKISKLHKIIEEKSENIEFLKNLNNFCEMKEICKKLIGETSQRNEKKRKNEEESEISNRLREKMINTDFNRERQIIEDTNELENCLNEKNSLKIQSTDLKSKIRAIEEKLSDIKRVLFQHYTVILAQGKDTRKEGLIWVIKAIWKLNYEIPISSFPPFVDNKLVEFLFKASHKSIEIQNEKNKIDEIKMFSKYKKVDKVFRTKLDPDVLGVRHSKAKSIFELDAIQNKKIDMGKLKRSFSIARPSLLSEDHRRGLSYVMGLEQNVMRLKNELQEMKNRELERISKEFVFNNYEKRFNIGIEFIISVIIGEDHVSSEYSSLVRTQKEHDQILAKCKTFNMVNVNLNKKSRNL